jgi:hypothetical protein
LLRRHLRELDLREGRVQLIGGRALVELGLGLEQLRVDERAQAARPGGGPWSGAPLTKIAGRRVTPSDFPSATSASTFFALRLVILRGEVLAVVLELGVSGPAVDREVVEVARGLAQLRRSTNLKKASLFWTENTASPAIAASRARSLPGSGKCFHTRRSFSGAERAP